MSNYWAKLSTFWDDYNQLPIKLLIWEKDQATQLDKVVQNMREDIATCLVCSQALLYLIVSPGCYKRNTTGCRMLSMYCFAVSVPEMLTKIGWLSKKMASQTIMPCCALQWPVQDLCVILDVSRKICAFHQDTVENGICQYRLYDPNQCSSTLIELGTTGSDLTIFSHER